MLGGDTLRDFATKTTYSAYMLHPSHGWMGTHRLPREAAITYCKEYRRGHGDIPVALVPDGLDPAPYFRFVEVGCKTTVTWRGRIIVLA